jgi:predicted nucleic acid-binding protein
VICAIDASVTLSWLLQDEHTRRSELLFTQVSDTGAIVPSHWCLEVANALQVAVKRRRIDVLSRDKALTSLQKFQIEVDSETNEQAWAGTLQLADRYHLTLYDAAYLELALRRCVPLATRDRDLAEAASRSGVTLLPTS